MTRTHSLFLLAFVLINVFVADAQVRFYSHNRLCEARTAVDRALLDAVNHGRGVLVQQLLQKGANAGATDDCGNSILKYATRSSRLNIMKLLIDSGADVNGADPPLFLALDGPEEDGYAVAKVLIDAGADVNVQDASGETPLIKAVSKEDARLVELLISSGANVNLHDADTRTAYSYAAALGNQKLKKMLLGAGADRAIGVEKYKKEWGEHAFFQAAADGRVEVVEAMLASGAATVNMTNASKATALMRAHDEEMTDVLLRAGADVNLRNAEGYTALIWAAAFNRKGIVKKLIAAGADVNVRNNDGKSAIDLAGPEIEAILREAGGTPKKAPF